MKYPRERVTEAKYTDIKGNPLIEAMPELISKTEFINAIKSEIAFPKNFSGWNAQRRRILLVELEKWFQPMDYMYQIYDMLYRAMASTYRTKTVVESVRHINQIYTDFRLGRQPAVQYSTQAYSGALLGVPGIGKTSTLKRCLDIIPQVLIHKKYQEKEFYVKQINYLIVECPFDCSVKTLVFNVFAAIDKAIGSSYFAQSANIRSASTSSLTTKLKIICLNHYIGLIVIDEIQNAILTAERNKQTRPLMKFLLELTNETSTAICFCGTLDAEELFSSQEHLKRRTRGFRLLPLKYDITYRKFITDLWEHQVTLQRRELTENLMKQIYDFSGGIPAYIVKIFEETQAQAIQSGKEIISYESIKHTVSYLGIEIPKFYGKTGTSISEFFVDEIQPDHKEYVDDNLENQVQYIQESQMQDHTKYQQEQDMKVPVRRFYSTQRGRKPSKRDISDIIAMYKANENIKELIKVLEKVQMIERRLF